MQLLLCKLDGRRLLRVGARARDAVLPRPPLALEAAEEEDDGAAEACGEREEAGERWVKRESAVEGSAPGPLV